MKAVRVHDFRCQQIFGEDFTQSIQIIAVVDFLIAADDILILFDGHRTTPPDMDRIRFGVKTKPATQIYRINLQT